MRWSFLLREVEGKELGDFGEFTRARRRLRMPVVLSREECARLFEAMEGVPKLMAVDVSLRQGAWQAKLTRR